MSYKTNIKYAGGSNEGGIKKTNNQEDEEKEACNNDERIKRRLLRRACDAAAMLMEPERLPMWLETQLFTKLLAASHGIFAVMAAKRGLRDGRRKK